MTAIDNYGEFELPEEKSVIEVVEDPVKVILSMYELFKAVSERKISKEIIKEYGANWVYDVQFRDGLYEETEKLFDGKEKIKLSDEQVKQVVGVVKKEAIPWDTSGIFLSALQNKTQLDLFIVDNMKTGVLGHKLKPNKTIVVGPRTSAITLGRKAQGNTMNLGNMKYQGVEASNGMHVNAGDLWYYGWACGSKNKEIYISIKKIYSEFDNWEGNRIVTYTHLAEKGIQTIYFFEENKINNLQGASDKINELDFLKTTKDTDELAKKIRSFDFKQFEEQLRRIVREEMIR